MRLFHLTIGVYVGDGYPLPVTFNDWIEQAGFEIPGSGPTFLHSVVEVRHPPARDVVARRAVIGNRMHRSEVKY